MADSSHVRFGSHQSSQTPGASSQQSNSSQLHARLAASTNWDVAIRNAVSQGGSNFLRRHEALTASSTSGRPLTPPLLSLPDVKTLSSESNPEDAIQSEHQLRMMKAFDEAGRMGLEGAIFEECCERLELKPTLKSSWRTLIDDYKNDNGRVFQLLLLLPDHIIRSLIRNTLSYDLYHDPDVKIFVHTRMKVNKSRPCAGIYLNVARRITPQTTLMAKAIHPDAGKWLTYEEIQRMMAKVDMYIKNDPDVNSQTQNYLLDKSLPLGKFTMSDRRWEISASSAVKVREWLNIVDQQFCNDVDLADRDKPFVRCPYEVGWAQHIPDRLKQHLNNANSTAIFEMVNAITRQSKKEGGAGFPEPLQLMLFPIWKDDKILPKLAEILGSVLCSSYWVYGGLNVTEAGNSVSTTYNDQHEVWYWSAQEVTHRLNFYQLDGLELERVSHRKDHAENLTKLKDKETEVSKLRAEMNHFLAETRAEQENLIQKKSELKEARGNLQDLLDESSSMKSDQSRRIEAFRSERLREKKIEEAVRALIDLSNASNESVIETIKQDLCQEEEDIVGQAIARVRKMKIEIRAEDEKAAATISRHRRPAEAEYIDLSGTQSTEDL